ncbi:MAG: DUF86 domain-containing protein [Candidatus Kuenenia sp.]|nr:DUF86 domain-containing protein [Candidatus Kuenenia hertensis]
MPEFYYAKGRISESLGYISKEMEEFESDYSEKTWSDYQSDKKLQKLMDRTVENILTALIEICGTILTQEGISCENYGDVLRRTGELFGFSEDEQETLAKLAIQRNRLAHRYLNFRWQVMKFYNDNKTLIQRLVSLILEREVKKQEGNL